MWMPPRDGDKKIKKVGFGFKGAAKKIRTDGLGLNEKLTGSAGTRDLVRGRAHTLIGRKGVRKSWPADQAMATVKGAGGPRYGSLTEAVSLRHLLRSLRSI